MCFGEFNRSYNNKYVQPIRRRVLKVMLQWVKDDPWKEMEKSSGGGILLFERIKAWTETVGKYGFDIAHSIRVRNIWRGQRQQN